MSAAEAAASRRLARTWLFRAEAERASSERFRRLSRELRAVHAQPVVIEMADQAIADETRHAALCLELARRYDPHAPHEPAHESGPVGDPSAPQRDRVLHEMVSFCCIAETMNVAVLTESHRTATDPEVRAAIHEIVRDEVAHARLGWAHLSAERALGHGASLTTALPRMLRDAHAETVFAHDDHVERANVAHGEITNATMRALLPRTMRTVIFPGLELHGIDTRAATRWLDELTGS